MQGNSLTSVPFSFSGKASLVELAKPTTESWRQCTFFSALVGSTGSCNLVWTQAVGLNTPNCSSSWKSVCQGQSESSGQGKATNTMKEPATEQFLQINPSHAAQHYQNLLRIEVMRKISAALLPPLCSGADKWAAWFTAGTAQSLSQC